jgi:di/tricarboxylate transporter
MIEVPPNLHMYAVMALTVGAFILFARDRIPIQTTAFGVLTALIVGFTLFPFRTEETSLRGLDFLLAFGHEALVAVCSLMVLGRGLAVTGALEPVARFFARVWAFAPWLAFGAMLLTCMALSGFVNDTPVVVLMLPVLAGIAARSGQSAARMMMPVNFAVLIGGMCTTIGTSTNLLVVSIAGNLGATQFSMFDFLPIVAPVAAVGFVYLWLIAPRLLPKLPNTFAETAPRVFDAILKIRAEGWADGRALSDVLERTGRRLKVQEVRRGDGLLLARLPTAQLNAGDRLLVTDQPENLKEYERLLGATLHGVEKDEEQIDAEHPLSAPGQQMAQVLVTESSPLVGRTLRHTRFADSYRLVILGIHRPGVEKALEVEELRDAVLRAGDILLLQGPKERIQDLKRTGDLMVFDATVDLPHSRKAPVALVIMALVVTAAALKLLPIAAAALCGVLGMLVTRCLRWEEMAGALSDKVILVIVASLALGRALMETGGAALAAEGFIAVVSGLQPGYVVAALMLLMSLLTNFVTNNAAAVIGTPIAVAVAQSLGIAPEPMVLAVLLGCNLSFATPMAYQTNLMVMAAAGYRFRDFVRVGVPLVIIMLTGLTLSIVRYYGL